MTRCVGVGQPVDPDGAQRSLPGPSLGNYIINNRNGYKTLLRQHSVAYYLDVWVKKMPTNRSGGQDDRQFRGQGM